MPSWFYQSLIDRKDLFLYVGFADNYACKYVAEIQSIPCGGNRVQVSLHTGVLYQDGGSRTREKMT